MHMSGMDWVIVVVFICILTGMAIFTRRYTRGVADFLAANRCAGRYLLCIAWGMAAMGAVSVVSQFQKFYEVGLASSWWYSLSAPIMTFFALTGWIIYRFRETRALTLAQFFEIRYSQNFRVFVGIIAFLAGMINYGIFPAIGATFFMNYCGLPEYIGIVPTFYLVMFILLAISVYFTLSGGQVTVIATDFIQGMFANFVFVAILIIILKNFGINTILDGLEYAPAGRSMLNPVDIQGNEGFNLWYFLIFAIMSVYSYKAWQAEQGYNCSARTPHEAKMAGILGSYRWWAFLGAVTLIPLCAYTIMHHPDYSTKAAEVQIALNKIDNPEVRSQMVTPIAMTTFIPSGLMGCFVAAMLAAFISTHNTQLHSWGSIFIQDVILPFRKTPLSTKTHMRLLKLAVVMVAVIVFVFSCLFKQTQHFQIYAMVSGAVYIGGAGVVIIGGLYWKRGTTAGAWAAMITGAAIAISSLLLEQYWVYVHGESFPIDFKWWAATAMGCSATIYIVVSLLANKEFDMDRMLHRGKYSVKQNHEVQQTEKRRNWLVKLGITEEFSRLDKFLWWFSFCHSLFFFFYVLVITLIYLTVGFSDRVWRYCHAVKLWWVVLLFVPIALFLTIGGFRDLFMFFKHLEEAKQNAVDDGTVVDHHNLADETVVSELDNEQ